MRIYKVPSAEALRKAIPALRQEKARASAENAATVWSVAARQGKPDAFRFYIKIGRSATLCRDRDGAEIVIGDMNVKEARAMATGLTEIEGGA